MADTQGRVSSGSVEMGDVNEDPDGLDLFTDLHITLPSPRQLLVAIQTECCTQANIAVASFMTAGTLAMSALAARLQGSNPGAASHRLAAATARAMEKVTSFTKSLTFTNMVDKTFDECDFDQSGSVDATEVYCMVLRLYEKINGIAKVATPPKEQINLLVRKHDLDKNGTLDRHEFRNLARLLCKNVALRVAAEMTVKLALAPMAVSIIFWLLGSLRIWSRLPLARVRSMVPWRTTTVAFVSTVVVPALIGSIDSSVVERASAAARTRGERKAT